MFLNMDNMVSSIHGRCAISTKHDENSIRNQWKINFSTRIKDAGIAIRHSRGRILFYTAGSRNGLERVVGGGSGHKKQVDPKKNTRVCHRQIN